MRGSLEEPPGLLTDALSTFESTLDRAWSRLRRGDLTTASVWAQIAAHFATYRHTGFYASEPLESLLSEIGQRVGNMGPPPRPLPERGTKRRILHVLTRALPVGGHTRALERWVRNDDLSIHSLIATAHTDPFPSFLIDAIESSGGSCASLATPSAGLPLRAARLRALARQSADIVVCHVHPYDVVPAIAFGVAGGPPVILFNHSDATFWVGVTAVDLVADMREAGKRHSLERRGANRSSLLPIPLSRPMACATRDEARRELALPLDAVLLLTIGEGFKFVASEDYDFFGAAGRILQRHPKARLVAIGLESPQRWQARVETIAPGRAQIFEPLKSVITFQAAADVYLDPFPACSLTAALETAAHGVPVVGLRNAKNPLFSSFSDPAFEEAPWHVESVADYEARVETLIRESSLRQAEGNRAASRAQAAHCPPGWNVFLERVLRELPDRHAPSSLGPLAHPDDGDLALARFEALGAPRFDLAECVGFSSRYLPIAARAGLIRDAFRARDRRRLLSFRTYAPERLLVTGKRAARAASRIRRRRAPACDLAPRSPRSLPPGPRGLPWAGSLPAYRADTLDFLTRSAARYGDLVFYRLGRQKVCLVAHPDHIERVLVTDARILPKGLMSDPGGVLQTLVGAGMLTSDGAPWRERRRLAQPAFAAERMKAYAQRVMAIARSHMADWRDGEVRDLHKEMTHLAVAVIGELFLGLPLEGEIAPIGSVIEIAMREHTARILRPIWLPGRFPTPGKRRFRAAMKRFEATLERISTARRSRPAGDDLLSSWQSHRGADGRPADPLDIRDEIATFLLAGHDTTALALSWCWHLLGQNPAAERALEDELESQLAGRAPAFEDLRRLPYVNNVLREVLRLFPTAWGFTRICLEDYEIGGFQLEPRTSLLLCPWVTHRDGRFFEEPEAFRPDRWTGELASRMPKYAYFPFGAGPRHCIGSSFGMMEAALLLATIAQRFRFDPVPGHRVVPWPAITLRPGNGLPMILRKRGGACPRMSGDAQRLD